MLLPFADAKGAVVAASAGDVSSLNWKVVGLFELLFELDIMGVLFEPGGPRPAGRGWPRSAAAADSRGSGPRRSGVVLSCRIPWTAAELRGGRARGSSLHGVLACRVLLVGEMLSSSIHAVIVRGSSSLHGVLFLFAPRPELRAARLRAARV